jgi:hypothetical protein
MASTGRARPGPLWSRSLHFWRSAALRRWFLMAAALSYAAAERKVRPLHPVEEPGGNRGRRHLW